MREKIEFVKSLGLKVTDKSKKIAIEVYKREIKQRDQFDLKVVTLGMDS